MEIYDIIVEKMDGEEVTLEAYKDKVLLIVNTASKCGYTPQFQDLQELYEEFGNEDFEILGFPSGQFLKQEYESNTEILHYCRTNYGVSFPMFSKTLVKGRKISGLYKYLTSNSPVRKGKKIKWNFEKFLVNKNGEIVNRYLSKVRPWDLKSDIESLL